MAVKDGQDTTALKAEIAEKFGKLEEVRVFNDNEQIASLYMIPFFPFMPWPLEVDLSFS